MGQPISRDIEQDFTVTIPDGDSESTPFRIGGSAGFAIGIDNSAAAFTGVFAILHCKERKGTYRYLGKRDYTGLAYIDMANFTGLDVWVPAPTDVFELGGYIKLQRFTDDTFTVPVVADEWVIDITTKV